MRKILALAGCAATIAALGALPSGASAAGYEECGSISGETHGVEWSGTVAAKNVSCANARRLVRMCVQKGELKEGWTFAQTSTGVLKFSKGARRVSAAIAADDPFVCQASKGRASPMSG